MTAAAGAQVGGLPQGMTVIAGPPPSEAFRARHKRMGLMYRLLDLDYGVRIAIDDVAGLTSPMSITWALIFDVGVLFIFGLIWWAYDLRSTWTTLDPFASGLVEVIPKDNQLWTVAGWIIEQVLRLLVTLFPTIIQIRFPQMAMRHDAAWVALWASAVFDLATDSVDVMADVPVFFGWLITAANNANVNVWWALLALAVILYFTHGDYGLIWIGVGALATTILLFENAGQLTEWALVGFFTAFASFAAQSLFFIHFFKVIALIQHRRQVIASYRPPTIV